MNDLNVGQKMEKKKRLMKITLDFFKKVHKAEATE